MTDAQAKLAAALIESLTTLALQAMQNVQQINGTLKQAQAEGRDFTADELATFDKMFDTAVATWTNLAKPTV